MAQEEAKITGKAKPLRSGSGAVRGEADLGREAPMCVEQDQPLAAILRRRQEGFDVDPIAVDVTRPDIGTVSWRRAVDDLPDTSTASQWRQRNRLGG